MDVDLVAWCGSGFGSVVLMWIWSRGVDVDCIFDGTIVGSEIVVNVW